jgi:type IV secretion system protein VirB4
MGGKYLDISRDLVQLAPFVDCDDEEYVKIFLLGWLYHVYEANNQNIPAGKTEKKAILDAIERLAEIPRKHRTIERFIAQLDDTPIQGVFAEFNRALPNRILSGTDNSVFDHHVNLFDKEPISRLNDSLAIPLLDFIYYMQIDSIKKNPTQFLMVLDESSFEFAHPYMRPRMMKYIKMTRHMSGAMIFAMQSIIDALGNEVNERKITQFKDNIATIIYLPNPKASADKISRENYELEGLNEQQIDIIANAIAQREYYVKQGEYCKLINLEVGRLALSFMDLTHENVEEINKLIELTGSGDKDWAYKWLEYRNVV